MNTASGDVPSDSEASEYSGEVIGPISLKQYEELSQTATPSNARYVLQTSDANSSDSEQEIATTSSGRKRPNKSRPAKQPKKSSAMVKKTQKKTQAAKKKASVVAPKKSVVPSRTPPPTIDPLTTMEQDTPTTPPQVKGLRLQVQSGSSLLTPKKTPELPSRLHVAPAVDPLTTSEVPAVPMVVEDTPRSSGQQLHVQSQENSILQELAKTNSLLAQLMGDVKKTMQRVDSLEAKLTTSSPKPGSSTDTPAAKTSRKKEVPLEVRRETRRVYNVLVEEDEEFNGWLIAPGITFKSTANQTTVDHLVREVKGLNSDFAAQHIYEAAYRFYKSQCEQSSVQRRGKDEQKRNLRRRRERLARKLQERKAALEKVSFTNEEQRERWKVAMDVQLMSSEESGVDGDEEVLIVKPLLWRNEQVNDLFKRLDERSSQDRSAQALRQAKRRVQSVTPSARIKPAGSTYPAWLFKK